MMVSIGLVMHSFKRIEKYGRSFNELFFPDSRPHRSKRGFVSSMFKSSVRQVLFDVEWNLEKL